MHQHLVATTVANASVAVISTIGTVMFAMTDAVVIAIVGAIVTIITSVAAAYFAYKAKVVANETQVVAKETSKAVNGKMEEFKVMAEKLFRAEGVAEGKDIAESKAAVVAEAKAAGKAEGKAENAAAAKVMPNAAQEHTVKIPPQSPLPR